MSDFVPVFRKSLLTEREREEIDRTETMNSDPLRKLPWRYSYSRNRRMTPKINSTQGNYEEGSCRKVWTPDDTCAVSFLQNWDLRIDAFENEEPPRLIRRPYPIYNFLLHHNALTYFARFIALIAPIACVVIIGKQFAELTLLGRRYWLWKVVLFIHCLHLFLNVATISLATEKYPRRLSYFYIKWTPFAVAISQVVAFMLEVWRGAKDIKSVQHLLPKVSMLEVYYAIVPFLACGAWTLLWGVMCYRFMRWCGYNDWLSTFDRDWEPGKTKWWWRPATLGTLLRHLWKRSDTSTPDSQP
ncbi:hypothetical protein CC86DRAFT_419573 [Ophiobolus disseminans]|uniref:Uncharacterized protein n=1 Tax=Ophiobolus disseminans TaxID=1469910 RepID=A0A6A6ZXE9_9PLEO|nr:hypothetical protein CC86DRAFT_419573 [Ophiobolus disseminans]